jgi:hypothetical protein
MFSWFMFVAEMMEQGLTLQPRDFSSLFFEHPFGDARRSPVMAEGGADCTPDWSRDAPIAFFPTTTTHADSRSRWRD